MFQNVLKIYKEASLNRLTFVQTNALESWNERTSDMTSTQPLQYTTPSPLDGLCDAYDEDRIRRESRISHHPVPSQLHSKHCPSLVAAAQLPSAHGFNKHTKLKGLESPDRPCTWLSYVIGASRGIQILRPSSRRSTPLLPGELSGRLRRSSQMP